MAKRIKKTATKSRRKKTKPAPRKSAQTDGPLAPGPRKNKLAGKLGHVSRNHKRRSTWFQTRASWPLREACVGKLVSERARVENEVAPASDSEKEHVWMVYITLDPNRPATVFTGSSRVWRSKDDGDTWKAVSGSLDGSAISAIEVAPADSQRIYVATENGGFFRSLDGGTTWSPNMAGPELPGVTITRLESSPTKADVVFATIANFGNSHVFRSDDGGAHWNDVDGGRLPDVPHHAVVVSPDDPKTVYVASDAGIHVSKDLGGTWSSLKRNLPNTMCVDLVFHQGAGTLTTATYGRSIWRLKVRGAA